MNGAIIYRGPSMLDGSPIVVVVTGLAKVTANEKTGDMLQTWILRDDISPLEAVKSGADASICGDCIHRPANAGSCYVTVHQAPTSVWRAVQRGVYPTRDPLGLGAGRMVRLGSYGDPAAVPVEVWQGLTDGAKGWTGYTHQWRDMSVAVRSTFQRLVMASADTLAESFYAQGQGWRTFRVRTADEQLESREFVCPASAEADYKTDCASCRACMGTSGKAKANPVIITHGARARRFALHVNGQLQAA